MHIDSLEMLPLASDDDSAEYLHRQQVDHLSPNPPAQHIPLRIEDTMSGEPSTVKRYDADFKKVPGTLSITAAAIAWVPKTPGAMDRQSQALNRAMGTSTWL